MSFLQEYDATITASEDLEFVKKLSGEEHVVKVTENMDGMAKPTTSLSNAPLITKRLCKLQRASTSSSKERRLWQRSTPWSEGPVENNQLAEFNVRQHHRQEVESSGRAKSKA